jgi:aminoglycoside N3'-acetyltransferase
VAGPRLGPFGEKAFAAESPWERLWRWNAAYCFIGVTFRVNTMMHYVESLVVERVLERAAPARRDGLAAEVAGWMKPGVWPSVRANDREAIERLLAEKGIVRYGKIGSATLRCARARAMVDRWIAILERDPERWFPEDFLQGLERIPRGGIA